MGAVWTLAIKDLRLLVRDKANAFFTFVFPVLMAMFFGYVFRGNSGEGSGRLDVVLVVEDRSKQADAFAGDLRGDSALRVVDAPTRGEGESMVRRGKATACIIVPEGFGKGLSKVMAGGRASLEAVVAPGRSAEAGLLEGKLNELGFRQMGSAFNDFDALKDSLRDARDQIQADPGVPAPMRGALGSLYDSLEGLSREMAKDDSEPGPAESNNPLAGWRPIEVSVTQLKAKGRSGPANSFEVSFPQGVVWGLVGCLTAFAFALTSERTSGTLVRLFAAPSPRWMVLAGKALGCFIAAVAVEVLLLGLATIAFGARVSQPVTMGLAVVCSALAFTGLMMLVASLCKSEGGAAGAARAVVLVLALIGGGSVPIFVMPKTMQMLSNVSPFKWAVQAFEGGLWRNLTPAQAVPTLLVLVGMGLAAGIAGGVLFSRWRLA